MAQIRLPCSVHGQLIVPTDLKTGSKKVNRTCSWLLHEDHKTRREKQSISCMRKLTASHDLRVYNLVSTKQWSINSFSLWGSDGEETPPSGPVSPSEAVERFYDCINSREWKKLGDLISDDCCFEDYSFLNPFHGKKKVMHFFQQLTESMGQNLKFVIQSDCKGYASTTVAVMWHLEWNNNQIPFTRGCSFYECIKQGERFLIKHAQVVIESPIKPGPLVLTALKLVTSMFDEFPTVTERFLQKPHIILQFILKIYNIFVEPLVNPILMCYINLWKLLAQFLGYALNILINISRFFF